MPRSVQQIEFGKWPSGQGRTIAILTLSPSDLSRVLGLQFSEDYDDLDYYVQASFVLPSGRTGVLVRYRGEPENETSFEIDSLDDADEARLELLDVLQETPSTFAWIGSALT